MPLRHLVTAALSASALVGTVRAQASTCPKPNAPPDSAPSVAPGFRIEVVARGLRKPRGIIFDREGGLLVVERNRGISRLTLTGDGACVQADGNVQSVVEDKTLEHGIAFSEDGNTLYASSYSTAYAWDYDASQGRTTSDPRVIVQGMGPYENHTTRTLLMSKAAPGMLVVSRGSVGNIDPLALDKTSGRATIKAFNVTNMTGSAYEYASSGLLLGWGLRNSAGVAEDPASGAIYSVENSVDDIERNGQLINNDNPGEELNFHGYLNGRKSDVQGGNYGYPYCYAAWNPSQIPGYKGVVGEQFAIGDQNDTANDEICKKKYIAPRLALQAHTAPLDIKFNPSGTAAWVTMHGSWNREEPAGYKLLFIPFDGKGSPKAPSTSTTAGTDIIFDTELSECPKSTSCFRPVGLAWDSKGRLFVSGDQAGEIYVVTKEDGSGVADVSDAGKVKDGGYEGGKPAQMEAGPDARESTGSSDRYGVLESVVYWVLGALVVSIFV